MDSPWIAKANVVMASVRVSTGRKCLLWKEELRDAGMKDRTSSAAVATALQPPATSAKRCTATRARSGLITRPFICACFTNVKSLAAIRPSRPCEVEIDTARIQIFTKI